MKSNQHQTHHRLGFTLVELLVVIVIVATLATLGVMGARRALDSAARAKTMGNLKQLASTAMIFSSDNNGALMDTWQTVSGGQQRSWAHHLMVTLSPEMTENKKYETSAGDQLARSLEIFADPKALKAAKGKLPESGHESWRSFGYNNRIGAFIPANPGTNPWKTGAKYVNAVEEAHKLILFTQPKLSGDNYPYFAQPGDANNGRVDFDLHNGISLVGFLDGHVREYSKFNYPGNGGTNPRSNSKYTTAELNELWLGRATPFTAP